MITHQEIPGMTWVTNSGIGEKDYSRSEQTCNEYFAMKFAVPVDDFVTIHCEVLPHMYSTYVMDEYKELIDAWHKYIDDMLLLAMRLHELRADLHL